MTRIIAGSAGGRRLMTPAGGGTRPTSDRVREALFSAIESWCGSLVGLRFLDLYAGSGAVGLEAWSRGADEVTFIERTRESAAIISANAKSLGFAAGTVVTSEVAKALLRRPTAPYDVIFSDPPYDLPDDAVHADLLALLSGGWMGSGALIVIERRARGVAQVWPEGIQPGTHKRYGDTALWYGHASPTDSGPTGEERG